MKCLTWDGILRGMGLRAQWEVGFSFSLAPHAPALINKIF